MLYLFHFRVFGFFMVTLTLSINQLRKKPLKARNSHIVSIFSIGVEYRKSILEHLSLHLLKSEMVIYAGKLEYNFTQSGTKFDQNDFSTFGESLPVNLNYSSHRPIIKKSRSKLIITKVQ